MKLGSKLLPHADSEREKSFHRKMVDQKIKLHKQASAKVDEEISQVIHTERHKEKNKDWLIVESRVISVQSLWWLNVKQAFKFHFQVKGLLRQYLKRTQLVKRKVASEPVIYHHTNKQLKKSLEHRISLSVSLQSALCKRSAHLLTLSWAIRAELETSVALQRVNGMYNCNWTVHRSHNEVSVRGCVPMCVSVHTWASKVYR